jgi:hypothetical protein
MNDIKEGISKDVPIQTERLEIPYFLYSLNPSRSIKQLLGQNITIVSYEVNDIITNDDQVIVDVKYTSIPFSLLKIYYINVSELKRLIPNSEKYVITINGCNVKISSPRLKEYNKVLPIRIKATLSNNYSSAGQLDSQFLYYGTTVTTPMNYLCTPLKYINHKFEPFETEVIEPIHTKEFKDTFDKKINEKFNELLEETIKYYKQSLSAFNILSPIDHVLNAKTFTECKFGTTGYVIPFDIIPINKDLNGIILIQPKRIPNYVLYYPTRNFTICEEELVSIKGFLEQDAVNYYNFQYVREVLNK